MKRCIITILILLASLTCTAAGAVDWHSNTEGELRHVDAGML
jgi:hypothetical protein